MFEQTFQGTKLCMPEVVHPSYPPYWQHVVYSKTWDAFVGQGITYAYRNLYKIFLDGTCIKVGPSSNGFNLVSRPEGLVGYLCSAAESTPSGGYFYPAFEITGTLNNNADPLNEHKLDSYEVYFYRFIDEKNKIFLSTALLMNSPFYVKSTVDGSTIATINFPLGMIDSVSWVREGVVCCFDYSTGYTYFLDYLWTHSIIGTGQIDPCQMAAYDCTSNAIFAIDMNGYSRVYVPESWPTILTAPAFNTTPVYAMRANIVRVRLTGNVGEPCPNWWVHWDLVNDHGWLLRTVSETDADGYAENVYIGPSDNVPTTETIQASVVVS